jgi:hypothetical protein
MNDVRVCARDARPPQARRPRATCRNALPLLTGGQVVQTDMVACRRGLPGGGRSCQMTTGLTTTVTTVGPSTTSPTAPKCTYRAWPRLLPAPGSVAVRGSSPLSSTLSSTEFPTVKVPAVGCDGSSGRGGSAPAFSAVSRFSATSLRSAWISAPRLHEGQDPKHWLGTGLTLLKLLGR